MSDLQAAGGTAIGAPAPASWARPWWLALAVGAAGFALDLGTKIFVLANLDPARPVPILGGLVTFRLVRNPGAAFSMGENFTVVLALIAIAALGFVLVYLLPRVRKVGWAVAEGLLLAGILGNLFDRLFREPGPLHGHVIDFIQLPYFAIFNVADMCITAAAVLIVWFTLIAQTGPDGRSLKDAS